MFVQVIRGRTKDAAAFRATSQRWVEEVRPGAIGYLGGTTGVADDGTAIIVAQFEDDVAAKANSERPEQTAFWEAHSAQLFDGEPTFRETTDVSLLFDGQPAAAGFVQVMEGRVTDRAKADAFETPELVAQLRAARPDLLGSIRAWFDGNDFVEIAYFTSETDARKGEATAEFDAPREDFVALYGEISYTDLRDPQLTK